LGCKSFFHGEKDSRIFVSPTIVWQGACGPASFSLYNSLGSMKIDRGWLSWIDTFKIVHELATQREFACGPDQSRTGRKQSAIHCATTAVFFRQNFNFPTKTKQSDGLWCTLTKCIWQRALGSPWLSSILKVPEAHPLQNS
jgi:hypothetical protein